MKYRLDPSAAADLREAVRYYRDEWGTERARKFLAEFRHLMGLLAEFPEMGTSVGDGACKFRLKKFRHSVVYRITGDEIQVLIVYHHSRDPAYWRSRL